MLVFPHSMEVDFGSFAETGTVRDKSRENTVKDNDQTHERLKGTLIQYAHFQGKPVCQMTTQH